VNAAPGGTPASAAPAGAAITADHLTIRFGSFTAVDDVSISVKRGEIFGFLGPNGSGKTTLIKALCGLIVPASGTGTILGMDIRRDASLIKQSVGYMSHKFGLYEDLTVAENIDFYAGVYGIRGEQAKTRKSEVVALTGIAAYMDRRAAQLSGGWKQRLALACAIIHSPQVVFLDEPTAGIDPVARRTLWDLFFRLSGQGVTFFVTTHHMDEAERCGRVGYIYNSRLIAIGTVAELQQLPDANPPATTRVEIEVPNPSQTLDRIRAIPGVLEATIFGHAIHALVQQDKLADLQRQIPNARIQAIEPSLEDVFVTLTYKIMAESK
jgi:ABC-2 type transport system ATP-binding protein